MLFDSKTFRGPGALKSAEDAYRSANAGEQGAWTVWPDGWTFLDKTLTHEFGHAVDQRRFGGSVDITKLAEAPSRYAKTLPAEFWAESFVEFEAGLDTAAARAVADKLR